jgi:signal transduction histidine kinase
MGRPKRQGIGGAPGHRAARIVSVARHAGSVDGAPRPGAASVLAVIVMLSLAATGAIAVLDPRLGVMDSDNLREGQLYAGDLFFLLAIAVLFLGAILEITRSEAALVRTAVSSERARVADELRAGIAQELALMSLQTKRHAGRAASRGHSRRSPRRWSGRSTSRAAPSPPSRGARSRSARGPRASRRSAAARSTRGRGP